MCKRDTVDCLVGEEAVPIARAFPHIGLYRSRKRNKFWPRSGFSMLD